MLFGDGKGAVTQGFGDGIGSGSAFEREGCVQTSQTVWVGSSRKVERAFPGSCLTDGCA